VGSLPLPAPHLVPTTRRSAHYKTYGITTWSKGITKYCSLAWSSFRVLSAVRLGLRLPSIFRRRRSFSAAGEGLWAYQEGQMGQKMGCFGQLRPTRSRQDESIEVGEVGSKRPPLGCNGVHIVWCSGLIFWLLRCSALEKYRSGGKKFARIFF
jgi:hypothetical protein